MSDINFRPSDPVGAYHYIVVLLVLALSVGAIWYLRRNQGKLNIHFGRQPSSRHQWSKVATLDTSTTLYELRIEGTTYSIIKAREGVLLIDKHTEDKSGCE